MSPLWLTTRLRAWKEVVWLPGLLVAGGVWAALQGYQWFKSEWLQPEAQERWRLPSVLPALPWWGWALGWLGLCVVVILEGAYRSIRDRDATIASREQTTTSQRAAEPQLDVVFDPTCAGCFRSGALACLGVWNNGPAAEDVHVYLVSVTPGRSVGKRELAWYGEGARGRRLHQTAGSDGHHHVWLLVAGPGEPYSLASGTHDLNPPKSPYTVEILVEGRNVPPTVAKFVIDPRMEHHGPPIRRVTA